MKIKKFLARFLGTIIIFLGIALGFFLHGVTIWGDFEAILFSSGIDANKSLSTLRCPVLISPTEESEITAVLKNPTDGEWERYTRAFISEGYVTLMREIKMPVQIPAGGKTTAKWDISPEDAAFDRIIFFRVYVNAKYPYPSLGGTCGIVVFSLWNLTGEQTYLLIVAAAVFCLIVGNILLFYAFKPAGRKTRNTINSINALATLLGVGTLTGYLGYWLVGLPLFVAAILLIGIIIGRRMSISL
jgi:hypothetical protein